MHLNKLLIVGGFSLMVASCLGAEDGGVDETGAGQGPSAGEETETVSSALSVANLNVGEYLFPGQGLTAPNCYYRLRMQTDGNLVIYAGPGAALPLWATNTTSRFVGAYAVLQRDGNFVLYNKWKAALFATHTNFLSNPRLAMQNDGNLVVYQGTKAHWSSKTVNPQLSWPCNQIEQSESTLVESGYDRNGGDYTWFYTTGGMDECGRACAQDARCLAFTYVPSGIQNPTQAVCWLKDRVTPAIPSSAGMISGIKKFANAP